MVSMLALPVLYLLFGKGSQSMSEPAEDEAFAETNGSAGWQQVIG